MTVEEDLLGFVFVIIAIISSIAKAKKKAQATQGRKAAQKPAAKQAPLTMETLQAWFEEETAEKTSAAKEMTHEGIHPCDTHSSEPAKAAQPRVQPRVQVTEKPVAMLGSMGVDSHEGVHPCDEHEAAPLQAARPAAASQEQSGIQLDWNGDNLVKAFVMQEVLTRPCQRRRA